MRRTVVGAAVLVGLSAAGISVASADTPSSCTVQVVAHEDDDLLFMNPDLQRDVRAGSCVRTVYLTAGDAGQRTAYWRAREAGVKAAYATMAGTNGGWTDGTVVAAGRTVATSTLQDTKISLVFLRLPDGFSGTGSASRGHQSLQKLWEGSIGRITPVDGTLSYSRAELIEALRALLEGATHIRIQDFRGDSGPVGTVGDGDHHDHHAGAYFAYAAQRLVTGAHDVVAYRGYPITRFPANVSGGDRALKKSAFFSYSAFDERIGCKDDESCVADPLDAWRRSAYLPWLSRSYPVEGPAADGSVEVRALSNTCLDVRDVSPADGAVIQLWECAGSANQHWTVPATGAGPVRGFAGKCLDADPTGAVRLWECTGAESQRWRYTAEGELRGPGELCLDVDESSLHAGAATTLAACTGTRHQKWRLV